MEKEEKKSFEDINIVPFIGGLILLFLPILCLKLDYLPGDVFPPLFRIGVIISAIGAIISFYLAVQRKKEMMNQRYIFILVILIVIITFCCGTRLVSMT